MDNHNIAKIRGQAQNWLSIQITCKTLTTYGYPNFLYGCPNSLYGWQNSLWLAFNHLWLANFSHPHQQNPIWVSLDIC